jgi:hypothetical protein
MREKGRYECYKCGMVMDFASQLSPRSRCVMCEYESNQFNEKENERLRKKLADSHLVDKLNPLITGDIDN